MIFSVNQKISVESTICRDAIGYRYNIPGSREQERDLTNFEFVFALQIELT